MNMTQTSELLNTLLSQTSKKSEIKTYQCFIKVISSLEDKGLNEMQTKIITEKLSNMKLETATENRKKYYKKKLCEFKEFLKNEFSFTTQQHYTELYMVYGMSLGTALGLGIGVGIDPVLGTSIGLPIGIGVGMVFGMMYGAQKDAEAKKLDRII